MKMGLKLIKISIIILVLFSCKKPKSNIISDIEFTALKNKYYSEKNKVILFDTMKKQVVIHLIEGKNNIQLFKLNSKGFYDVENIINCIEINNLRDLLDTDNKEQFGFRLFTSYLAFGLKKEELKHYDKKKLEIVIDSIKKKNKNIPNFSNYEIDAIYSYIDRTPDSAKMFPPDAARVSE